MKECSNAVREVEYTPEASRIKRRSVSTHAEAQQCLGGVLLVRNIICLEGMSVHW